MSPNTQNTIRVYRSTKCKTVLLRLSGHNFTIILMGLAGEVRFWHVCQ